MNGSTLKMAGEEALRQNIAETKRYIEEHSGGGHSIVNSSGTVMTSRSKLKFKGQDITDDATNDTTVIEPEIRVVETQEEWEQMTPQEKNNPNVTWLLPWKTNPDTNRHQIVNGNGTLFTDRAKLQIIGGYVEDDSENNTTKIYVWNALLTITTPSALLYGKTITIKKDGVTVGTVAFSSQGVASYPVHEVGTYKCYCDGYESDDISVEEEKAYSVVIRAGLDLHEWITAGSTTEYPLNPSSYADFSALEADEAAVRQLMTVHDAVDYLAQATAGDSLMESVIGSDVCAKWINLSDYALDTLYANSDIKDEMDTADKYGYGEWGIVDSTTTPPTWGALGNVSIMTDNNAPYGTASASSTRTNFYPYYAFDNESHGWVSGNNADSQLEYQFVNPVKVESYKISSDMSEGLTEATDRLQNYKIQGYDGTQWVDLTEVMTYQGTSVGGLYGSDEYGKITKNAGYYQKYRAYIYKPTTYIPGIHTLQFYGRELKPLVPTMTGNTTPKGEVIVSHEGSETNGKSYMTFDGNLTQGWYLFTNDSAYVNREEYVGYIGDDAFKVTHAFIRLNTANGAGNFRYKIQKNDGGAWNDKTDWISVTSKIGGINALISLNSPSNGGSYRLFSDRMVTGPFVYNVFSEAQFYGMDYSEKEFAAGSTRKTIYDHGVKPNGALLFNSPWQAGDRYNAPIENSNSIDVYNPNNANNDSGFITSNSIAISTDGISNLYCKVGGRLERFYKFVVASTNTGSWGSDLVSQKQIEPPITDTTASLDVSSDSSGYIGVLNYNGSTPAGASYARITELWLE